MVFHEVLVDPLCGIGASHCRLMHIGWENCGHGLTSLPRETSSVALLNELLVLFWYPANSGDALLCGVPPLRHNARFACRVLLGVFPSRDTLLT